MPFILGVNIAESFLVKTALQTFFGVGKDTAARLMARLSIHNMARLGSLPTQRIIAMETEMTKLTIENDLKRKILDDILRLRTMGTYRGRRHAQGLPVRGQNTQTQIESARKLNRTNRKLGKTDTL